MLGYYERVTNARDVGNLLPNEYSIEYFNDSYIFIERETVSEEEKMKLMKENKEVPSEVIILKFESLFEYQ